MKAKYIDDKLYVFEKTSGMTGVFSEDELEKLIRYINSNEKNRIYTEII